MYSLSLSRTARTGVLDFVLAAGLEPCAAFMPEFILYLLSWCAYLVSALSMDGSFTCPLDLACLFVGAVMLFCMGADLAGSGGKSYGQDKLFCRCRALYLAGFLYSMPAALAFSGEVSYAMATDYGYAGYTFRFPAYAMLAMFVCWAAVLFHLLRSLLSRVFQMSGRIKSFLAVWTWVSVVATMFLSFAAVRYFAYINKYVLHSGYLTIHAFVNSILGISL